MKYISMHQDTISLDSVSIVPNSLFVIGSQGVLDSSAFTIDAIKSVLTWNKNTDAFKTISADSIEVHDRAFGFSFTESIQHKDASFLTKPSSSGFNQYVYNPSESQPSFFKYEIINRFSLRSLQVTWII